MARQVGKFSGCSVHSLNFIPPSSNFLDKDTSSSSVLIYVNQTKTSYSKASRDIFDKVISVYINEHGYN